MNEWSYDVTKVMTFGSTRKYMAIVLAEDGAA